MSEQSVEIARLTETMRELRAASGLSLAALAERTAYSKSSWERYLNGKKFPPRQAVEELVRACRAERETARRIGALWELADAAWSGRGGKPAPTAAAALEPASATDADAGPASGSGSVASTATGEPEPRAGRRARWRGALRAGIRGRRGAVLGLAGAGALAVAGALVVFGFPGGAPGGAASTPPYPEPTVGCQGAECTGKDPERNACAAVGEGALTVAKHNFADGTWMDIRYSPECEAGWARIWFAEVGDQAMVTSTEAESVEYQSVRIRDEFDQESYVYTPMTGVFDRSELQACLRPKDGGERECFRP